MSKTLLITSIPPPIKRGDLDQTKYEWTRMCIDSWKSHGHEVVSVNIQNEVKVLENIFPDVNYILTDKSTLLMNGRPLVFIFDALQKVTKLGFERYAICNADIYITQDLTKLNLDPLTCSYSNRIDIENINSDSGVLFGGIDYFNFSNEFFKNLPQNYFCLGLPWWDYWYPLYASINDFNLLRIVNPEKVPVIYHKIHGDAWSPSELCNMGNHFFTMIRSRKAMHSNENEFMQSYMENPPPSIKEANYYALLARETCTHIHNSASEHIITK